MAWNISSAIEKHCEPISEAWNREQCSAIISSASETAVKFLENQKQVWSANDALETLFMGDGAESVDRICPGWKTNPQQITCVESQAEKIRFAARMINPSKSRDAGLLSRSRVAAREEEDLKDGRDSIGIEIGEGLNWSSATYRDVYALWNKNALEEYRFDSPDNFLTMRATSATDIAITTGPLFYPLYNKTLYRLKLGLKIFGGDNVADQVQYACHSQINMSVNSQYKMSVRL